MEKIDKITTSKIKKIFLRKNVKTVSILKIEISVNQLKFISLYSGKHISSRKNIIRIE